MKKLLIILAMAFAVSLQANAEYNQQIDMENQLYGTGNPNYRPRDTGSRQLDSMNAQLYDMQQSENRLRAYSAQQQQQQQQQPYNPYLGR